MRLDTTEITSRVGGLLALDRFRCNCTEHEFSLESDLRRRAYVANFSFWREDPEIGETRNPTRAGAAAYVFAHPPLSGLWEGSAVELTEWVVATLVRHGRAIHKMMKTDLVNGIEFSDE